MSVQDYYDRQLAERGFQADAAQQAAIARLQQLDDDLQEYERKLANPLTRWLNKPSAPRGVYLWGGVGRGKSFLMDAFHASVGVKRKTRLHFHEFMRGIHQQLDEVRGRSDPLDEVARRVAQRYRLICFDEFHVSDIADAMILYRLLEGLFAHGTTFVMTSNYPPSGLYPDGLHRDRLLPAIALIEARMDVMTVDAGVDYRRRELQQADLYHMPLDAAAEAAMAQAFERLAPSRRLDTNLTVSNRPMPAIAVAEGIAWFDFETLCGGPRSQNDYLELASRFHTVLLSGVPRMGVREASPARRFTWLVDVFYDHKVTLLLSADGPPESLYTEGPLANEFHRTVSRLEEMQSQEYLDTERRDAAVL